jgi:pyruvate formate lyase activating enzyme
LRKAALRSTLIGVVSGTARFFQARPDLGISCSLCPHACLIAEGKHGVCRARFNRGGTMEIPFYGRISALSVDPIEKKPLYHYYPGSRILSAGFVGCSLRCRFCQNWHISQSTDAETRFVSPAEMVRAAREQGSFGIAYTYSEPLIHLEYVLETAALARAAGLKNVLVSNGYIKREPAEEALSLVDAANIDLKSFDPVFYKEETGGDLEDVKRFIAQAAGRIHLEVTTLVIPTKNDDPAQVEGIARFLARLDRNIPLHLSCYYPQYKYDLPPTPVETVRMLAELARRHLPYVYLGNVGGEETNTVCPGCGNLLVRRRGYSTSVVGLRAGACTRCGAPSPVVTADSGASRT